MLIYVNKQINCLRTVLPELSCIIIILLSLLVSRVLCGGKVSGKEENGREPGFQRVKGFRQDSQFSLSPSSMDRRTQRNDKPSDITHCRYTSNSCQGRKKHLENQARLRSFPKLQVTCTGQKWPGALAKTVSQVDMKVNSRFRETAPF